MIHGMEFQSAVVRRHEWGVRIDWQTEEVAQASPRQVELAATRGALVSNSLSAFEFEPFSGHNRRPCSGESVRYSSTV